MIFTEYLDGGMTEMESTDVVPRKRLSSMDEMKDDLKLYELKEAYAYTLIPVMDMFYNLYKNMIERVMCNLVGVIH